MSEVLELSLRTYQKIEAGNIPQKATMARLTQKLGITELHLVQTGAAALSATPPTKSSLIGDIVKLLVSADQAQLLEILGFIQTGYGKSPIKSTDLGHKSG